MKLKDLWSTAYEEACDMGYTQEDAERYADDQVDSYVDYQYQRGKDQARGLE